MVIPKTGISTVRISPSRTLGWRVVGASTDTSLEKVFAGNIHLYRGFSTNRCDGRVHQVHRVQFISTLQKRSSFSGTEGHVDNVSINWLAVGVATILAFVLGGLWYSPALFGKVWQTDTGLTDDVLKQRSMAKVFGVSFLLELLIFINMAYFLGPAADLTFGLTAGFATGFGFIAMALGVTYVFEGKPLRLFLVDAGYHVVACTIGGAVIGWM